MSEVSKYRFHEIPVVTYKEKCDTCMGMLVINGLMLPGKDPLGAMWAAGPRKRIFDEFGVDVAGLFVYDDEKEVVSCSFYLNFGVVTEAEVKVYAARFRDTFSQQMALFEDVLEAFLGDEDDGYLAYLDLLKNGEVSDEVAKDFFNRFLRKINIRKKKDDRRSAAKKAARSTKAKK